MQDNGRAFNRSGDHPPCEIALERLTAGSDPQRLVDKVLTRLKEGERNFVILLANAKVDSAGIGSMISSFCAVKEAGAEIRFVISPRLLTILTRMKIHTALSLSTPED